MFPHLGLRQKHTEEKSDTVPAPEFLIAMATTRIPQNIDPEEVLRYFSWSRFAVVAVVYTGFVFWTELAKDGPFIFSRKNARSKLQVLEAHAIFLALLLFAYRICINIVPKLPFWVTNTFQMYYIPTSIADILACLAALGMGYFERNWLYRERHQTFGTSEISSTDAPTTDGE